MFLYSENFNRSYVFRYSEFDDLRRDLIKTFPYAEGSLPELPRKSVICMALSTVIF